MTGPAQQSLSTQQARLLATTTKTVPQMEAITPRWLLRLLPWIDVPSGTYRVNRVKVAYRPGERVEIAVTDEGQPTITPKALGRLPLFEAVEREVLESIAARFAPLEQGLGETVIQEGDPSETFFIVTSGTVEVTKTGPRGERLRLWHLGPGDFFGEIALMEESTALAQVKALTAATFLTLTKKDFEATLSEAPEIRAGLQEVAAERKRLAEMTEAHGEQTTPIGAGHEGEPDLPELFIDYDSAPSEYPLSVVQSILRIHTRVSDLYNNPIDQLREQLRLTIEAVREQQEWETVNNPNFGLLSQAAPTMRIRPHYGPPTPDDMDALLARVWKKPCYFLAHPRAIAAFERECTFRGVPPVTVRLFGSPVITWRGVPVVPCDKLEVRGHALDGPGTTNIILMRVGDQERGVIGLHQTGIPGEVSPSLSVKFMKIDGKAIASYLVTNYTSCAVLAADALGVLENVEVGFYHGYEHA